MPRLFIRTFGCQMNEYDSAKMLDVLNNAAGYELTDDEEQADVLLLNSCSIREKAQEKVFSQLGRWNRLKRRRPGLIIGVGGCVASQEGEGITARAPYVDLVFGPQTLHRLPQMLTALKDTGRSQVDVSFPEIEKFDYMPAARAEGATALVSIIEGCSKFCTFCVVPYTRGEEVSRPVTQVLDEVHALALQGVKEITLLGQTVNAYAGEREDGEECDLAGLIRLVADIDGIERIRFMTSHPVEFNDALIAAYRDVPKLASYLHLPVQSGSDRVLSLMGRRHTVLEYKQKIRKLRAVRPDITISSDFIVGFPGESDQDFAGTMKLVAEVGFDQSFSFIYSRRPGTPAASLLDEVSHDEKQQRLEQLQARLNSQAAAISETMLGSVQRVLVTGPSKTNDQLLSGRTENMRWVHFEGPPQLINQFVAVQIVEVLRNSLRGRWVSAAVPDAARVATG
ncbi:MAG: tRNA (N6-isopentenyl adenosine(37)-C2)-methylthiotransferase MiaB [Steroidobacteraceae bacterium]